MSLDLLGTINDQTGSSARFVDAVSDQNGTLYTITTQPRIVSYNLNTLAAIASSVTTGVSTPAGITLISPVSGVVVSAGVSQVDFFQTATLTRVGVTTGASTVANQNCNQQVAGNTSTLLALATRSTAGGVMLINGNTFVLSTLSSTAMTGLNARCIITKGSNWLVGTTGGTILEMTASGVVVNTITIPNTPNVGVTPTFYVTSLAYSNGYLLASTTQGVLYLYNYSTNTLLGQTTVATADANNSGCPLSLASSGMAIMGRSYTAGNSYTDVAEVYFGSGQIIMSSVFFHEINQAYNVCGFDVSTNRGWTIANTTTPLYQLRVFNVSPTNTVSVDTLILNSVANPISGRIIRIRRDEVGKAVVELDQNIGAGITFLPATDGHNYIELGINSLGTQCDVREFKA